MCTDAWSDKVERLLTYPPGQFDGDLAEDQKFDRRGHIVHSQETLTAASLTYQATISAGKSKTAAYQIILEDFKVAPSTLRDWITNQKLYLSRNLEGRQPVMNEDDWVIIREMIAVLHRRRIAFANEQMQAWVCCFYRCILNVLRLLYLERFVY